MKDFNGAWVTGQLDAFIWLSAGRVYDEWGEEKWEIRGPLDDAKALLPIVELIFSRFLPGWNNPPIINSEEESGEKVFWDRFRDLAIRARTLVKYHQEILDNLGDGSPTLSASNLHPWVWSGAFSLWQSKHYHSAVEDAAKKVNAETQNKVDRRDVSETQLFTEAFSDNAAQPGKPRLRRMKPDGSETYRSLQRGARTFAEGIFAGIRNPLSHEADQELSEQVALEYLAALSVLARWVDESIVEYAEECD